MKSLDVKNTTLAPSVQRENKLNNNIFLLIVRLLLVIIKINVCVCISFMHS